MRIDLFWMGVALGHGFAVGVGGSLVGLYLLARLLDWLPIKSDRPSTGEEGK